MRSLILAAVVATGLGLAGSSSALAAPAHGAVIGDGVAAAQSVDQVRWCVRWYTNREGQPYCAIWSDGHPQGHGHAHQQPHRPPPKPHRPHHHNHWRW